MKKLVLLFFVAAIVLLSACTALAKAEPQLEQMLTAIEENDEEAVIALLHPKLLESIEEEELLQKISMWHEFFHGETWEKYAYNNVSVNVSGSRTEEATCRLTLSDGTKLNLKYVYLTDDEAEGFSTFWLETTND